MFFGQFFHNKIQKIRSSIINNDNTDGQNKSEVTYAGPLLKLFNPVTTVDVMEVIRYTPPKTCSLDAIPTSLLIQCLDILLEPITEIINHSLEFGVFPECYKNGLVKPLLKKHGLNPEDLQNYRPVTNLPYISKLLEKIVLKQLRDHLESNKLMDPFQSAYRLRHSTESALLKITNDILMGCDAGRITILTLLDQSAAFDLIDHPILFDRLGKNFGITDIALSWIRSYLTNRSIIIDINGMRSNPIGMKIGVPQGSVLGPLLYVLFTSPLGPLIRSHSISHHCYADDNQSYKSSIPPELPTLKSDIEECFKDIKRWMNNNKLKLNDNKTEIMVCSTTSSQVYVDFDHLTLDDTDIPISQKAKNLGVILDNNISMEFQINNIVKQMNFEIHRISRLKPYLSLNSLKQVVSALILSRLDYCNSLLAGLPNYQLDKLQRVQNHAARLVLGRKYSDHATDMLIELHWLPVRARIEYKLATICFTTLRFSQSPAYLQDLLHVYQPSRTLRSQDSITLTIPKTKLKTFGDRAFAHSGPTVWNSLPNSLKNLTCVDTFKKMLKTHLFEKHLLQ